MEQYFEILEKCPLFCSISKQDLSHLLNCLDCKLISFEKDKAIFSQGDSADIFGIVAEGYVNITYLDFHGNRNIVAKLGEGMLFGESFAFSHRETFPVSAYSEGCAVLIIKADKIISPCPSPCSFHQKLIYNMLRITADKNVSLHQKSQITSQRTTRRKLAEYLSVVSQQKNSRSFTVPFNRQELADYLEVDRSGLSAEISKMQKEGIIFSKGSYFELLDDNIII